MPGNNNGILLDPRQKLCWEKYIDPESPTFSNGAQSAIAAGYSESFADKVLTTDWFKGRLRRLNLKNKGEQVLEEMLNLPLYVATGEVKGKDGVEVPFVKIDPALVKIKQDTAKFVTERLGKDDWSTRNEVTGAGGGPVAITNESKAQADKAIDDFLTSTGARISPDGSESEPERPNEGDQAAISLE